MSTPGNQKPSDSGDSKQPSGGDFDQTLPEGDFDQTMSEDSVDSVPPSTPPDESPPKGEIAAPELPDDSATMIVDEPAAADEGATMIGDEPSTADENATMIGDESSVPDEGATMLSDDGGVPPSEDDYGKTLPEGALAEATPEEEDFGGKTMMLDSAARDESSAAEDDYGKTIQDSASAESIDDSADADKTMIGDVASSGMDNGDDFGKTIQVDSFAATMTDDGDTLPREDFDAKTIVGSDSAIEQNEPPAKANIPVGRTMADSDAAKTRGTVFASQATHWRTDFRSRNGSRRREHRRRHRKGRSEYRDPADHRFDLRQNPQSRFQAGQGAR